MLDTPPSNGQRYEIRLKGYLEARWANWFDHMTITWDDTGETLLSGVLIDQAALHGTLKKIRDLGMPLISVNQVFAKERGNNQSIE